MKPSERKKARRLAMQAIYQWQYTALPAADIIAHMDAENDFKRTDRAYFEGLVTGFINASASIDAQLREFTDRDLEKLTPVELAVMRLATHELVHCLDVPYRVVINEALALTKKFGTEDGYKYVNGVLDKLARKLRDGEQ